MIVCVAVIEKSNDATVVYNGKQWTVIIEVILMGIVIVITSKENARLISLSFSFFLAAIAFTQSALAEIRPCNVIYHATTLVTRRRRRRHLTAIPIHTTITSLFTISLIVTVYSFNLYLLAITLHQHLTIFIAILVVLNYFHPETPSAVAIHPRHPFLPHPPHHRPRVVVLDH